jgi:protein associated with RNAse G/E
MDEVTVYKCNHAGEVVWQYKGAILDRGPDWLCITAIFDQRETDLGFVSFRQGDMFTEWFYSSRWYNVFRIQDGQTTRLKGWYCNITRPAQISQDSVRADDLALDVFVMPNGNIVLLDEAQFDALNLPSEERIAALRAVEMIRSAAIERRYPFEEIRSDTDRLR